MRAFLFAVAAACTLAACGQQQPAEAPAPQATAPAATLEISAPWAAPTPGGVDVSAGYLTITNGTAADDRLLSASSSRAARVEIHEMAMEGAVMRMRAVEQLTIPANGQVALAPGGLHLMFFGVTQPFAEGENIDVHLVFATAGERDVSLAVRRPPPHGEGH